MRDVFDVPVPASRSTHVARVDARYREVPRAASLLEWGVLQGVGGEPLLMSERETWQIYEYWVYLYLVSTFDTSVWRCRAQTAAGWPTTRQSPGDSCQDARVARFVDSSMDARVKRCWAACLDTPSWVPILAQVVSL